MYQAGQTAQLHGHHLLQFSIRIKAGSFKPLVLCCSLQAGVQLSAIRTILVDEELSQLSHCGVKVSLME